jgi:hypothetical protein
MSTDIGASEPLVIESLRFLLISESECELAGALDSDVAQQELGRQLDKIHGDIQAGRLDGFKVDVRPLEFVNSSALRLFVTWISRAQSGGYKLTFVIDRSITWQRLSFSSLRSLAPECVDLVDAKGASKSSRGEMSQ